jgi:molecular chaperone GrpE
MEKTENTSGASKDAKSPQAESSQNGETQKAEVIMDSESNEPTSLKAVGEDIEAEAAKPVDEKEALQAEVYELKDKYLRTMAEMENVRRRADKDRSDLIKFGMESFFKDLLVVLDSFEKAAPESQEADGKEQGQFLEGIVLVKKQLNDVVAKHGLQKVEAEGTKFDPNIHQAIQKIEEDGATEETVGQEFATGYLLNGRLLRPSMVSVKVPKA